MDAKRISSFVYSKALQNQVVTVSEVASILARSRDYVTTARGDGRPTDGELERARFALEQLCKQNRSLRRYVDFHSTEEAQGEPQHS